MNKAPTTRFHRVLFNADSPFKARRVERKDTYRRNQKHKRDYDN